MPYETVILTRDVEAAIVPTGDRVTLLKGEAASITQALGGSYSVVVNGNMFRIDGKNADALGKEEAASPTAPDSTNPLTLEEVQEQAYEQLRTCYDPEMPVNILDLGLVYECQVEPVFDGNGYRIDITMTLTAPGCGMGDLISHDVRSKLLTIPGVKETNVEMVWEPVWSQGMMSDAAKLELGMFY